MLQRAVVAGLKLRPFTYILFILFSNISCSHKYLVSHKTLDPQKTSGRDNSDSTSVRLKLNWLVRAALLKHLRELVMRGMTFDWLVSSFEPKSFWSYRLHRN